MAEMAHGKYHTYTNHKCKCEPCVTAWRDWSRNLRRRRLAERVLVNGRLIHPRAPHGTRGGRSNYGCQCLPCRVADAAYAKTRYRKQVSA